MKDDYVLAYTWDGDRKVTGPSSRARCRSGRTARTPSPRPTATTEVAYSITIDLSIPMLGMIKRKAEKVILDTALKELKKRVEG